MTTAVLEFDEHGEQLPAPVLEHVDADIYGRAMRTHRWREQQAAKLGKRWEEITNGEISPDDIHNARADRLAHADPVGAEVVRILNNPITAKAPEPDKVRHPLSGSPVEALVFTLNCVDGPLALNRAGVLALWTAKRNGSLHVAGLTRKRAQEIAGGGK